MSPSLAGTNLYSLVNWRSAIVYTVLEALLEHLFCPRPVVGALCNAAICLSICLYVLLSVPIARWQYVHITISNAFDGWQHGMPTFNCHQWGGPYHFAKHYLMLTLFRIHASSWNRTKKLSMSAVVYRYFTVVRIDQYSL